MKLLLFDADGVLTLPEELFSVLYARTHGLSNEPFEQFFKTEWKDYVTGRKDILQHIEANPDLWQWSGTAEQLMDYWCRSEDIRNEEMLDRIRRLKKRGVACYLATEQERYRGAYMKNVMFPGLFDDYFVTAEIGYLKSQPQFYDYILKQIRKHHAHLSSENVILFDDSQSKVDAAQQAGLRAYLFTSAKQFDVDVERELTQ